MTQEPWKHEVLVQLDVGFNQFAVGRSDEVEWGLRYD